MPIMEQQRKEDISQAYVRAVVAKAGYNLERAEHDYGQDGTIKDVVELRGDYIPSTFGIIYQLKSSWNVQFTDDYIIYDLEKKNYNELTLERTAFPMILVLFVIPKDERNWLDVSEDKMTIRKCAWWHSLEGKPLSNNSATERIYIPRNQIFTPDALTALMNKAKGGERL